MLRVGVIGFLAGLLLLFGSVTGCVQTENHSDEEQDPHFQRGRNLAASQDYPGAAQEFEKALESNPRSAAAHFELGWLYDNKLNDYAAAIYHYKRHLDLQPDSERAALVKERIRGCKQQLASSEFILPDSRNLQKEVDRLNADNMTLREQLRVLQEKPAAVVNTSPASSPSRYAAVDHAATRIETRSTTSSHSSSGHMHVVKSHETVTSIAAQYGTKASAILAANPQLDPRHMRVGQSLNLP